VGVADSEYDQLLAMAADELQRLVRRLGGLSRSAWTSRRGAVELALHRLAELDFHLEKRPRRQLPRIEDHALADAVEGGGGDVLRNLRDLPRHDDLAVALTEIRAALQGTR
jgi:hypothetical protein